MSSIYAVYSLTEMKEPTSTKVTYGITSYRADIISRPVSPSLIKTIRKKVAKNKKIEEDNIFSFDILYQNIERKECQRYMELVGLASKKANKDAHELMNSVIKPNNEEEDKKTGDNELISEPQPSI